MQKMNERSEVKMNKFASFFHASLLLHHFYVFKYTKENLNYNSTNIDVLDMETYRFRYLTTWNMILQFFYLSLAVYTDVIKLLNKKENKLFRSTEDIRGYLFTSLVFPTGLFVSFMFWSIFNIDRELVFPQHLDLVVPCWVNHSIHTMILALPFVEVLFYKKVPNFKSALIGTTIFALLYNTTYFFTYYQSSRWLYKIFNVLSWPERFGFVMFNYAFSVLVLWMGINIQRFIMNKKYQNITLHKTMSKKLM